MAFSGFWRIRSTSCGRIEKETSAQDVGFGNAPGTGTVRSLRWGLALKFRLKAVSSAVFPALFWPVMILMPGFRSSAAGS